MLATKSDGTVVAWGYNLWGQVGDGTTANLSGHVQLTGVTIATQIAAGGASSSAVHTVAYLLGS